MKEFYLFITKLLVYFLLVSSLKSYSVLIPEKELKELIQLAETALQRVSEIERSIDGRPKKEVEVAQLVDMSVASKAISGAYGRHGTKQFAAIGLSSGSMMVPFSTGPDPLTSATEAISQGNMLSYQYQSLQRIKESIKIFYQQQVESLHESLSDLLDTYGYADNPTLEATFTSYFQVIQPALVSQTASAICAGVVTELELKKQLQAYAAFLQQVKTTATQLLPPSDYCEPAS